MAEIQPHQVLSNLYGLMMEINLHRTDEEVLAELQNNPDSQIDKHLLKIKQLKARLKAEATKVRFQNALDQLNALKQKGLDEIKNLIQPQEQAQLMPLFRKFEELTKEDETAILEDQELLHFIEILKDRVDEDSKS